MQIACVEKISEQCVVPMFCHLPKVKHLTFHGHRVQKIQIFQMKKKLNNYILRVEVQWLKVKV